MHDFKTIPATNWLFPFSWRVKIAEIIYINWNYSFISIRMMQETKLLCEKKRCVKWNLIFIFDVLRLLYNNTVWESLNIKWRLYISQYCVNRKCLIFICITYWLYVEKCKVVLCLTCHFYTVFFKYMRLISVLRIEEYRRVTLT